MYVYGHVKRKSAQQSRDVWSNGVKSFFVYMFV